MTYTHLTTNELVMIEAYFNMHQSVTVVAKTSNRSRQTIYNVYNFLKQGQSIHDYYQQYQKIKHGAADDPFVCQQNKMRISETRWRKDGHPM